MYCNRCIKFDLIYKEASGTLKLAEVQDMRHMTQEKEYDSYISHGHESRTSNKLWALIDGNIEVKNDNNDIDSVHHIQWSADIIDNTFYGRVEDNKGFTTLTIVTPDRWKFRPVPEALINLLTQKFSPDSVKVYGL